ncbi:MAG: hypothetical protein DWH79_06980 [Planctomycetota bacterium]|nr:MAG: hypothetical protein DWH79_06980 [Planctomycetota bacterium]
MAIQVLCGSCKATFAVSDQFAGRTGPCPKCKAPITIPAAPIKGVTIHEPEAPSTTSTATGRAPTAPFKRTDRGVTAIQWTLLAMGSVLALAAAMVARVVWHGDPPREFLAAGAVLLAIPCAFLGYAAIRERELAPHRGRSLLLRTLICAAVYAALWAAYGFLPPGIEMWQWLYVAPIFVGIGAFAAFACFDFESGSAVAHFSLYLLVTAGLRWLAGVTTF